MQNMQNVKNRGMAMTGLVVSTKSRTLHVTASFFKLQHRQIRYSGS